MLKKKKTTASGKLDLVKSVRRTRSHRMKFCVQRGLGALPSTSKRRGKSRRDFLLCGPVCINTGIACQSLPSLSCNITKSDFMCVLLYLLTLSVTIAHRTRVCAGPCESRQRIARTNTHRSTIHAVRVMLSCPDAIHPSE